MAKERHILGIDEGTTSVRAVLVSMEGRITHRVGREFPLYTPQPGYVEQDGGEIWDATRRVVSDLLNSAPDAEIAAIGLTNQRETTLLWDRKTHQPVHRAIVWQDRRTAPMCQELRDAGHSPMIEAKTGLVLDPYFSATKIRRILDGIPDSRDHTSQWAFGTMDSWLIWKLTAGKCHVTDPTNASRTMLFHIDRLNWDDDLLELFQVPHELLPEVRSSAGEFGETSGLDFLPDGIPIYGVAGDQQAALYGQRRFLPGEAKNTYGTGCFLLMNAGKSRPHSEHGLLTTLACDGDGLPVYALEGSVFVAGAAIQWLRDGLGILETARDSEAVAASVPDNGGVVFVPALTGLGAPYWQPDVHGAVFGITRGTTRAHLVRAALEAIAHQTADIAEAMERDIGVRLPTLRVDGGAVSNDFLMQFQSDILGIPVERPAEQETTVLGAAYLAGLRLGAWTAEDLRRLQPIERRFEPETDAALRDDARAAWREAVARLLPR